MPKEVTELFYLWGMSKVGFISLSVLICYAIFLFSQHKFLTNPGSSINKSISSIFQRKTEEVKASERSSIEATGVANDSEILSLNYTKQDAGQFYPAILDIVVSTTSRNLDFLQQWREFLQGYHFIILQDRGKSEEHLAIPEWLDYELYFCEDVKHLLKYHQNVIHACRANLGFLASKKPFIYTLSDTCSPSMDEDGYLINPLVAHLQNLGSPTSSRVFNSRDELYSASSHLHLGSNNLLSEVPTVLSHGSSLSVPYCDAHTFVVVPNGVFYSTSLMNVAFVREIIGPTFIQGLTTEEGHQWAAYDDLFSGWASKAVADHLGIGVKSGWPCIQQKKSSNSSIWFNGKKKELRRLEEVLKFFSDEVALPKGADTPQSAYLALADALEQRFENENFRRMASAMRSWVNIWDKVQSGKIRLQPSRRSSTNVTKTFRPLNLGSKSHYRHIENVGSDQSTIKQLLNLFEYWGPGKGQRLVTDSDIKRGHSWKTYLYPLSNAFHRDLYERYGSFGCLDRACPTEQLPNLPFQWADLSAEVIIFRKLLSSLNFVSNPMEADLFLVPFLGVTALWRHNDARNTSGCRNFGNCEDDLIYTMANRLKYLWHHNKTMRHLFLATQDYTQNHRFFRQMELYQKNCRVVTLGPGQMVVPSLNPDKQLQPQFWQGAIPLEDRDIFVHAAFGVRYPDRIRAMAELKKYNGSKNVVISEPAHPRSGSFARTFSAHRRSVFVLCLTGDLPFQKRIFDAWASVSIPVVVVRHFDYGPSYFDGLGFGFGHWGISPAVNASYPALPERVSYSDIVVEVNPEVLEKGKLLQHLERIPKPVLEEKLRKIERIRTWFLYDFDGATEDAFSILLRNIESWVLSNATR